MKTVEQIEQEFKDRFRSRCQDLGVTSLPHDEEIALSDWYKEEHNSLIADRVAREKSLERNENNKRVCEVCLTSLPIKRGRAPKRCEEHK